MFLLLSPLLLATEPPLIVGTHPVPPFVIKTESGWEGISIDLWKALAEEQKLSYEIREYPVSALLAGGESGEIDVIVSLNITAEREKVLDLTHAFENTGLAIAVPLEVEPAPMDILKRVLTPPILMAAGAVAALLLGMGTLMWLLERNKNPDEFGGTGGVLSGIFWAIETIIGYNDPQHQTRAGRALGVAWASFGVILLSTFTARLSSDLTLAGMETGVRGPDDLPGVVVGTMESSAGSRYCVQRALNCRTFPTAEAAVEALVEGSVAAVVYEAPVLQWLSAGKNQDKIRVLPGTFENHGYGFGLRQGSPLREQLDVALLQFVASERWPALRAKYLGG